jgi:hypothetical protein
MQSQHRKRRNLSQKLKKEYKFLTTKPTILQPKSKRLQPAQLRQLDRQRIKSHSQLTITKIQPKYSQGRVNRPFQFFVGFDPGLAQVEGQFFEGFDLFGQVYYLLHLVDF